MTRSNLPRLLAVLALVLAGLGVVVAQPAQAAAAPTFVFLGGYGSKVVGEPLILIAETHVSGTTGVPSGTVHFVRLADQNGPEQDLGTAPVAADGTARISTTPTVHGFGEYRADFHDLAGTYADSSSLALTQYFVTTPVLLTAEPTVLGITSSLKVTVNLTTKAHLTEVDGTPVVGETVSFYLGNVPGEPPPASVPAGSIVLCDGITDATGTATCGVRGTPGALISLLAGKVYAVHYPTPSPYDHGGASAVSRPVVLGGP